MIYNYGSINIDRIDILNNTQIRIMFASDRSGEYLGTLLFIGTCHFSYFSAKDDIEENEQVFITDFIIKQLNKKEMKKFSKNFWFQPIPKSLIPKFRVELNGGDIQMIFFCKEIKVLEKRVGFNFDNIKSK